MTLWQNEKNAKKMPTFLTTYNLYVFYFEQSTVSEFKKILIQSLNQKNLHNQIHYMMLLKNEQSIDARQEDKNYENESHQNGG